MFDIPQGSVTESCSKKGPIYTHKQYAQQVMCARVFGLRNMRQSMLSTQEGGTEGGGERMAMRSDLTAVLAGAWSSKAGEWRGDVHVTSIAMQ